ncbi:hypothetical protein [Pseudorhizobium flavum]|jgi:hypothetical protein|uniref:hypothetical protein n=1 Tax=Pseudorhizobium flavum TaxID=1335061 RepID=UPI00376F9A50
MEDLNQGDSDRDIAHATRVSPPGDLVQIAAALRELARYLADLAREPLYSQPSDDRTYTIRRWDSIDDPEATETEPKTE